jgi:hypothetical protein
MSESDQAVSMPAHKYTVAPQIPRRPKNVPPSVTIDPVNQAVADVYPVVITGSANPGISWTWNPADHDWYPQPAVTYTGVDVETDTGPGGAATSVGGDWAPWSATVRFPAPGAHWVTAAGSTTQEEVTSARQPVLVDDTLWRGHREPRGRAVRGADRPIRAGPRAHGQHCRKRLGRL